MATEHAICKVGLKFVVKLGITTLIKQARSFLFKNLVVNQANRSNASYHSGENEERHTNQTRLLKQLATKFSVTVK